MPKQKLAIALCRVSSTEQLQNNSLNRQRDAVIKAAQELGVTIPDDGWWSGSVSSKRGTNVGRKDLNEMLERCKKDKRISYVIVDEPDRFMRSIDEAAYFEVVFRQLEVSVWYASDASLNKGDLSSKLLKFTKYLSAEGSNEERQHKSIAGQTKALHEGRYPFPPKPGYKRGYERAIHEVDSTRGPALRLVLVRLADRLITPSEAVVELNQSRFVKGRALYKMDKFRLIATDPYYAGIVEMHKQVDVRNENGLHEALISKEQHYTLVRIMNDKKKNQAGPRKNGNPKYPLNNIVSCDLCTDKRNGRVVGYDHGNGHSNKIYEKYRCRACKRRITRDELHAQVLQQFGRVVLDDTELKDLVDALDIVWKRKEGEADQETNRITHKISALNESIDNQVEAATDPSNTSIKDEILVAIARKKDEVVGLENKLDELQSKADVDKERFLRFAFKFIENMGNHFMELPQEDRLRCKLLVFPAGFCLDADNKVHTPEISPFYRWETNKKDAEASRKSIMVRVKRL